MDKIIIKQITCFAHHGVLPEEQSLGQEFQVNVELGINLPDAPNDNIEKVFDYRVAVALVEEIMYGRQRKLLETLAADIADRLIALPGILEASIEVCKPNPPIPGVQGGISVIVCKSR